MNVDHTFSPFQEVGTSKERTRKEWVVVGKRCLRLEKSF